MVFNGVEEPGTVKIQQTLANPKSLGAEVVQISEIFGFSEPVRFEWRVVQCPFNALQKTYEYHSVGLLD